MVRPNLYLQTESNYRLIFKSHLPLTVVSQLTKVVASQLTAHISSINFLTPSTPSRPLRSPVAGYLTVGRFINLLGVKSLLIELPMQIW